MKATETFATSGKVRLWCETFGEEKDPALLLIMGSGGQGILWPTDFCIGLAKSGLYVIRYDHRDTGLSSLIDYQNDPYSLLEMADDAIAIFDHLQIDKAHVVGASLGASIATLLAVSSPERLHSAVLLMASSDVRHVFGPEYAALSALPKPKPEYVEWLTNYIKALSNNATEDEKVSFMLQGARLCNGTTFAFDETQYLQVRSMAMARSSSTQGTQHHLFAAKASLDELLTAPQKITVPTLVVHGDQDPIFSVEHAEHLVKAIKGAKLQIIAGMGHALNDSLCQLLQQMILDHVKNRGS